MIDITGIDKAELLAALVNHGRPLGMGIFQAGHMSTEKARAMLAQNEYIDYANGVPIKARFRGDSFEERLYDRDHGTGAAQRVIDSLKAGGAA